MKKLTYTKQTSLILHLEDYTNVGLTQTEIAKRLEEINGIWKVNKSSRNSVIEVHIDCNRESCICVDIEKALNIMTIEKLSERGFAVYHIGSANPLAGPYSSRDEADRNMVLIRKKAPISGFYVDFFNGESKLWV